MFKEVEQRLDSLEDGLRELKVEASHIKDEIKGLKAKLSNTPSRRQFHELKGRVDKYHPLS